MIKRFLRSVNHKDIGTLYIFFGSFFGVVGASMSRLMRWELMSPGTNFITNHSFNLMTTGHGVVMVFFFVMPFLIGGFGNWLIPLICSVADMSFPRINNFSFWLLLPAAFLLVESVMVRGARSGWTIYPPLSSGEGAIDYVILSLHCAGISSILGSANFLVSILMNSPKSSSVYLGSLYLWCMLVTAFMLLTTLPVLARCITMILFDRHLNTSYFDKGGGGDAVLFQHLF
jgi:heme/copper-type cytochrome/quinol oxidase subunit 1